MRKIWIVFKREYVTRVRTKGFVLTTFGLPVFLGGIFGFSILMAIRQPDRTLKIGIIDHSSGLAAAIAARLAGKLPNGQPAFEIVPGGAGLGGAQAADSVISGVRNGKLDGYIVVPSDALKTRRVEFHTRNTGDFASIGKITRAASDAFIERELSARGVEIANLSEVTRGADVTLVKITQRGEAEEKGQTFLIAIILAMLLYMTLLMYGIATMRSVLEEKTTRMMEVLVSSVRPFQLLLGKITGVAGVAFTQYLIWTAAALLVGACGAAMAATARPGSAIIGLRLPASLLASLVIFFLFGYFLYSSIYAAVGAACSNEQDAQQLQWPATAPILVSFLMFNYVLRDPSSTTSVVLSEIPFFSPILMLLRVASQPPPFWQVALSLVLMLLTTLGVVYFSARIYRVGVLMYGKRPSLVGMLRWARYS